MSESELRGLEDLLGHRFADLDLLDRARRHGSARTLCEGASYERLEFFGDAVLGHALAELLYEQEPEGDQGLLTKLKAQLASGRELAAVALELGLERWVLVGPSEDHPAGRKREALLEDVFEAIVGALALDGGWPKARDFVRDCFTERAKALDPSVLALADSKTTLQEAAQKRGFDLPVYRQLESSGPDHNPEFVFEVIWDGRGVAKGTGRSKRAAQVEAARAALRALDLV